MNLLVMTFIFSLEKNYYYQVFLHEEIKRSVQKPSLISMQCTLHFGIFILNFINNNYIVLSNKW